MASAKTTAETFTDLSGKIVYTPKTSEGSGFLPPLLRSLGHLLYAVGIADDELPEEKGAKNKDALDKVKGEIKAAIDHLDKVEISNNFSSIAQEQLKVFAKALTALNTEFDGWERDNQVNNLTSLIHRMFGITAMLDRELIGLRNSDPGSSL